MCMKNYKYIHWFNVHKYSKIKQALLANVNINSQPKLHHLPFNDMQLCNIEKKKI
jgi:hypothetical protein